MIFSRRDALAHSASYFYTGKPCRRGHVGPRFTANSACVICERMYRVCAGLEQKQRDRARQKRYDFQRRHQRRIYASEYYQKHKEIKTLIRRAHPYDDRARRAEKQYRKMRRRGKVWQDQIDIQSRIDDIYQTAKARRLNGEDVVVDHIIPINNPIVCGLHVPWNMQILTRAENSKKNNHFDPADFE